MPLDRIIAKVHRMQDAMGENQQSHLASQSRPRGENPAMARDTTEGMVKLQIQIGRLSLGVFALAAEQSSG